MMRYRLFSIGETAVYLHVATLLVCIYSFLVGQGLLFVVAMLSILMHEAAHGAAAHYFGQPPAEIELTPLGALMRLDDEASMTVPHRLIILLAGPLTTLLVCWLSLEMSKRTLIPADIGQSFFVCNLFLLGFNLIPVLPLDGGRIVSLVLSLWLRMETVKHIMRFSGTIVGLACIGLNLYLSLNDGGWNLSCAMAGCFIMYAGATATTSCAMAELRTFTDRKIRLHQRGSSACKLIAITENATLRYAMTRLSPCAYTIYLLVPQGSMCVAGWIGEEKVIAAYLNTPGGRCDCLVRKV